MIIYKAPIKIAIFFISFCFFTFAHADSDSGLCADRISEMKTNLNLTAEQEGKIKSIKENLVKDQMSNWKQLDDLNKKLREQAQSNQVDDAKLTQLSDEAGQLISQTIKAKTKAENQIFMTLNDEQKSKYKEFINKREDKIKEIFKQCH